MTDPSAIIVALWCVLLLGMVIGKRWHAEQQKPMSRDQYEARKRRWWWRLLWWS